ncbi:hypothetical protein NXG04_07420 [Klebsiella pneumoniae]|nr:hypothetical protein [Klebsiella pneumoniae]MDS7714382.1 hypothetical protein [Klebsiella pneumoniae]
MIIRKASDGEIPENAVRAYRLQDGDVITVNGMQLQYEDGKFYKGFSVGTGFFPEFHRNGGFYTAEDLNEMSRIQTPDSGISPHTKEILERSEKIIKESE